MVEKKTYLFIKGTWVHTCITNINVCPKTINLEENIGKIFVIWVSHRLSYMQHLNTNYEKNRLNLINIKNFYSLKALLKK